MVQSDLVNGSPPLRQDGAVDSLEALVYRVIALPVAEVVRPAATRTIQGKSCLIDQFQRFKRFLSELLLSSDVSM